MPYVFNPITGQLDLVNAAGGVAGADTQVQYNAGGVQAAGAGLTYDYTNNKLILKATGDLATLGSELITTPDFTNVAWTSTGWTTSTTTATHTSGNTSVLSTSQFSITAGLYYQVVFTVASASTTDFSTVTPRIGTVSGRAMTGNGTFTQIILATATSPSVSFVPTSTYVGVISAVSVKVITASNPVFNGTSSAGLSQFDLRTHAVATAQANLGIGIDAHKHHTGTGARNVALGGQALQNNTTGTVSMAIGFQSLGNQTTGSSNVAIGNQSGFGVVNATNNTAIGTSSYTAGNGSFVTAIGARALLGNTFGANNVALGYQAGYSSVAGNAVTTGSNNVFIGYNAGLGSSTQRSGATAIGAQATVSEDNMVVLGAKTGVNGATATQDTRVTGVLNADADVKLGVVGKGLYVKEGSNATMGQATLSAGTVTVATTKVTATSRIFLQTDGGTLTNVGFVWISARVNGTSFTVTSSNILDTSNVDWLIVEPA